MKMIQTATYSLLHGRIHTERNSSHIAALRLQPSTRRFLWKCFTLESANLQNNQTKSHHDEIFLSLSSLATFWLTEYIGGWFFLTISHLACCPLSGFPAGSGWHFYYYGCAHADERRGDGRPRLLFTFNQEDGNENHVVFIEYYILSASGSWSVAEYKFCPVMY